VISRASGRAGERSAVACAAYRAGEKIRDERIGQEFDYTRKGGVEESMILAPEGSPEWVKDRGQLWNQVEAAEIRKDAQLAREMDIALPFELTGEQRRDLIKSFVQEQFVQKGMVADVSIHQGLGEFAPNPHAHVMLTMREIHEEGFGKKVREWNDRALLGGWREQWEKAANRELENAGHEARIDHRTLEAQKEEALTKGQYERAIELDRAPTHHKGVVAINIHREGFESEKLERMKKTRAKELTPYLKERKELTALVQELRQVQGEQSKEPEYPKFTEAQRQAERLRQQEEQRRTREDQELERARTDKPFFGTIADRFVAELEKAERTHYDEAKKVIMERLKPTDERINNLAAEHRKEFEFRKGLEEESKTLINRIRLFVDPFLAESVKHDIAGANERREEYAKEHKELWDRRQKELSEENIMKEAARITWQRHPDLLERAQKYRRVLDEWEKKQNQPERQKQPEQQLERQRQMDKDKERGRGDPGLEL
jgi:hypothetical protein